MATVNFSVPEEVKEAFNKTFAGKNKSAIIARLMSEAVDQAMRQQQREEAFRLFGRDWRRGNAHFNRFARRAQPPRCLPPTGSRG